MKSKILIYSVMVLFFIFPHGFASADNNETVPAENIVEERYHSVLEQWKEQGVLDASNFEVSVPSSNSIGSDKQDLLTASESKGYGDSVFYWHNRQSVTYEIQVPKEGLYELSFDYYPLSNKVIPIEGAILVNGKFPYYESRRIVFPVEWKNETDDFEKDRFGNEIIPQQLTVNKWRSAKAEDASGLQPGALKYLLKKGTNVIELSNLRGEMLLGKLTVTSVTTLPSYNEYVKNYEGKQVKDLIINEAETNYTKNSSYIRPFASTDASAVPSNPKTLLLNTLGGDSWATSGQSVNWNVEIEKDGFYQLTFKVQQNKNTGAPVFRKVSIDGQIPFSEVAPYTFEFNKKWSNVTLSDQKGEPFLFYLTKGNHTIGLEADASQIERVVHTTNEVMKEIEALSLSIKKLTGNQTNRARGWKISEYIPDIKDRVERWAVILDEERSYLKSLSDTDNDSSEIVSLQLAVQKLKELSKKPDEIPNRMTELSEGSSSVAQLLGNLLVDLPKQPLLVDRFYLHGDLELPAARINFIEKAWSSVQRFALSFTSGNYTVDNTDDETIEIWVNRPRQYVEQLQNLADRTFTPETGIPVKFSLMPDESKLILSSAANKQPDVALGISNWLPYELSIRGAAVDLHQFKDFEAFSKKFSPGAFLPLMIEDSVYALPETQDFFVQFYRKDIMDAMNFPVPDDWEEVVNILPELQRFGMNYYTPISGAGGFKPFQTTAPYIYQFQGDLYEQDGMRTAIGTEEALKGIQFMAELNTIYSLPLQVPNFYNHFRYATMPIGISNFTTYVQLTSAAPEIAGWWDITPHPGVKQEDGTIERWATGSGQSAMIFKGTKDKEKSWELLKWWMSTETQTEYASSLQTLYGPEYMWNTANLEAFNELPWPEEHKETILEQWEYLQEVPKTPGAYMVERELSNIWNRIVFDGENTRSAVDDSIIAIDREISRKMEEFGYMKNGKVVKPYPIPTIEQVESWAGEENEEN
ncbi:ABC transporter substrate-binding protein [Bacillus sp. FJAT-18017]|uniref:extracellular solute-binding protein n=1 Tax=Bacillus sp. FJAT-18017 TaxID=1705566 RepID=UPI0006AED704|nr:extracellular solute-binding protein [Bacillus sp. FJAT-18017]ALC91412.1 ABC transporter substrate-binding protein [Bacillus sp. FJAT-18017]